MTERAVSLLKNRITALLISLPPHFINHCFEREIIFVIDYNVSSVHAVRDDHDGASIPNHFLKLVFERWMMMGLGETLDDNIGQRPEAVFMYTLDTLPIQNQWLVRVSETAAATPNFWMLGSEILSNTSNPPDFYSSLFNFEDVSFFKFYANMYGRINDGRSHGGFGDIRGLAPPLHASQFVVTNLTSPITAFSSASATDIHAIPKDIAILTGVDVEHVTKSLFGSEIRDRHALLWFKVHLHSYGESGIGGWLPKTLPCRDRWAHVECNAEGRVTSLNVANRRLIGRLAPQLVMLDKASVIDLHSNRFSGSIPEALYPILDRMTLHCNVLTEKGFRGNGTAMIKVNECRSCPDGAPVRTQDGLVPAQCDGSYRFKKDWLTARLTHVVMPFVPKQMKRIKKNLLLWPAFSPCNQTSPLGHNITFVFFPSIEYNVEMHERLIEMWEQVPTTLRACFSDMQILFASLTPEEDTYFDGSRYQFERLLRRAIPLKDPKYVMFMEPDCLPVREFWLDTLDLATRYPVPPFWLKGSVFHGDPKLTMMMDATWKEPEAIRDHVTMRFHINGNSIYNMMDPGLIVFYFNEVRSFVNYKLRRAYDLDIGMYLNPLVSYNAFKRYNHLFVSTDIILNLFHSNYSLSELLASNENVCLIHGGWQQV